MNDEPFLMDIEVLRGIGLLTNIEIMGRFAQHIIEAKEPPLCLACDTEFTLGSRPPDGMVVATPMKKDLPKTLTALCLHCASRSDDELKDRIFNAMKKGGMTGAKERHLYQAFRAERS